MKNTVYTYIVILCAVFLSTLQACESCGCQASSPPSPAPTGFVALFNGINLDGWFGHGTKDPQTLWAMTPEELAKHKAKTRQDLHRHWSVENGELVNDGEGLYATTDKDYGDFELHLEYKTVAKADSGIYLRGCPQVQIWDCTEAGGKFKLGADKGSGGLWNNDPCSPGKDPLKKMDKPFGQWNAVRIVMVGSRVTVWFNGERIVDHAIMHNYFNRKHPIYARGPIQLQTHGGEIRWRNIFIREIEPDEANRILRQGGPLRNDLDKEFKSLFNGENWDGWVGPTGKNQIANNAILSKSDTIYTEEVFEDFAVRFDFNLPEGGNNGLAIRYPGKGDTAYKGMCELQVLDNPSPKYAKLKPQQYHGSAYGMAPAHRGYLRPAGTWNHQVVTVHGSHIDVELNGTVILDTDLADIDPQNFMYDAERFEGRTRRSGHFGFAGHGNPVAYRHIEIKRIP